MADLEETADRFDVSGLGIQITHGPNLRVAKPHVRLQELLDAGARARHIISN